MLFELMEAKNQGPDLVATPASVMGKVAEEPVAKPAVQAGFLIAKKHIGW